jgi:putative SOS response-associated peptidase YedK
MCGRFTLRTPANIIARHFALLEFPPFEARFNIAPSQPVAVVRLRPKAPAAREAVWMRWGLIPSWAEDPSIGNRMINARSETVAEKSAFRTALRRRRCLVVADGFYEWKRAGARKQPYFFHMRDDGPFAFAGLWETWEAFNHAAVESCTLLTTEANALVREVHDRMPVILAAEDYARWLDPAVESPQALIPLLRPYSADAMTSYPVSAKVNSPTTDDPSCVEARDWQLGFGD